MVLILLVDPQPAEASLLGEALRSGSTGDRPIEVTTVSDPREAIRFAARHGCDVVVTDLNLPRPGWSGPYVLRRVRELCPQVRTFLLADSDAWAPLIGNAVDGLIARRPSDDSGQDLAERLLEALRTAASPAIGDGTWALSLATTATPPPKESGPFPRSSAGIGDTIAGKYRLEGELGHGGMGIVYRATDTFIGRQVAVKLLKFPVFLNGDPTVRERMRREVMITGRLSHPNLVTVFDSGIDRDEIYIVLELIEGTSLKEILLERRQLTVPEALDWLVPVLDALEYVHAQGIIHRDLKPGNILIARNGLPKVVDFGIAKLVSIATEDAQLPTAMTHPGAVLGTPAYMAPEQMFGEGIGPCCDIYALGAVLFEMLHGSSLSSLFSPFARMLRRPLPILANHPALTQLVEKAVAPLPEDRFASAAEMRSALLGLEPATPIQSQSPWWRS